MNEKICIYAGKLKNYSEDDEAFLFPNILVHILNSDFLLFYLPLYPLHVSCHMLTITFQILYN